MTAWQGRGQRTLANDDVALADRAVAIDDHDLVQAQRAKRQHLAAPGVGDVVLQPLQRFARRLCLRDGDSSSLRLPFSRGFTREQLAVIDLLHVAWRFAEQRADGHRPARAICDIHVVGLRLRRSNTSGSSKMDRTRLASRSWP